MTSQFDEKAIFDVARQIDAEAVRIDYLKQVCGDDQRLFDRVSALLQIRSQQPGFLETPAASIAPTIASPVSERPGTQIGPYKLIEEIGEGGMGVVYMAAQKEPVRRKVALKIIKPGMDTREVIARFAAEEQALALMDHPNIAKVLDAGSTESGRPYFVMELVSGVPLTQYCDDNNLTTQQRLELFVLVCHAVQHAHQKGIIHRDIKPSNILVTMHDGVPVPKIIDFGIAKAINQQLTADTVYTSHGQMIGTPLYMSPEQAELSGLDIDTRSDIYSLGVLLYELLTGSTPFDGEQLKDAGYDEVRRLIREQEPPRPSTRISTLGKAATTASERRRTSPVELSNSLRGELDWIVMKALDKDRTRRYQTANDFARDIERYLRDEPVEACPPSPVYRLKKFTRRHKTSVLATAGMALALIVGTGVAAGQAYRATRAEKLAEEQLHIAKEQRRLADEQAELARKQKRLAEESAEREGKLRAEAEQQRDLAQKATREAEAAQKEAEKVADFLVDIFRSPDPDRDGRTITVVETLDKAQTRVATEFADDRLLQAKLWGAIGDTYQSLGVGEECVTLFKNTYDVYREVLGPEHRTTMNALLRLGRATGSVPMLEEVFAWSKETLGEDAPDTILAMAYLGAAYNHAGRPEEAVALQEQAFQIATRTLGLEHQVTLMTARPLAWTYKDMGRLNEALPLCEAALRHWEKQLGPEHTVTLKAMCQLACVYNCLGRSNEALALCEKIVQVSTKKFRPDHAETLFNIALLAELYGTQFGRFSDTIRLLEKALPVMRDALGPGDDTTLYASEQLAVAYRWVGRLDEALRLAHETLRLTEAASEEHSITSMFVLADIHLAMGRLDQSIPLFEESLRLSREHNGPENVVTVLVTNLVAAAYGVAGRFADQKRLLEETLPTARSVLGADHPHTLICQEVLAGALANVGHVTEANELLSDVLKARLRTLGANHVFVASSMAQLAVQERIAGNFRRALGLSQSALDISRKVDIHTVFGFAHLLEHAKNLAYSGDYAAAIACYEECLQIQQELFSKNHLDSLRTMSLLAIAYEHVGRHNEALQLGEQALSLLRQSSAAATLDGAHTMGNIATMYVSAGRPQEGLALWDEVLPRLQKCYGAEHYATLVASAQLADAYVAVGRQDDATKLLKQSLPSMQKALGAEHPETLACMIRLGRAYANENKQAEAEMLLTGAYDGYAKRQASFPTPNGSSHP